MEKRKLLSAAPAQAQVELDWALAGLWLLGLLTLERRLRGRVPPDRWSVAESLRVLRRVLSGHRWRGEAHGLRALAGAVKDSYRRLRPKAARNWPAKKTEAPPRPPKTRTASREERQKIRAFKDKTTDEPLAA